MTWERGQRKDGAERPEGGTVNIDVTVVFGEPSEGGSP